MSDHLKSPAVPVEGGTLRVPVPPEIHTPHVIELRYVLYRMPGGYFFDFVNEDTEAIPEPVRAWLWARRAVLEWMLKERVEAHLKGPMLPPEVDVH